MGSASLAGKMYAPFAVAVVFLLDINFYKNNIQTIKEGSLTWHQCGELCEKKAGCSHWTLHHCEPFLNGECWPFPMDVCNLKTSDGGLEKKKGYTSGVRGCK